MWHGSRMSENTTPKPGPLPDALRYAAQAGYHARKASEYLAITDGLAHGADAAELATGDAAEDAAFVSMLAQAHALTSLAFTQLNPPARRRNRADHQPRVVKL
jgi:hypothetical protein